MLTKIDFSQIRKVVREETEAEGDRIRSDVGSEIKLAGIRTTTELREVNSRLKDIEIRSAKVEKEIIKLRSDLKKTIESHLGVPTPQII